MATTEKAKGLTPDEVMAELGLILGNDIKGRTEEYHTHIITKVHVKGSIVHEQLVKLTAMGEIDQVRSGDGITLTVKTKK